ncbi:postacrosomal sheath WW domain-binding protein [Lates japonicus]|uniref:Postacrosomal sheath WW domain-binding protein n=1 Tax=Lates japonicus TaxID=270547 RepID=A0AAD3NNX6_LATJO|nr:postacrosomal sheath WW domain-binding protein [Lates japonicus]
MALNRNHSQNGGVLVNSGESVLRECKNVELSFSDVTCKTDLLKGTKKGTVYLTPYRLLFVAGRARPISRCHSPSGGAIELGQHLFKLATNASLAILTHPPPQQNGFYQGPPPAAGNMGYAYPPAAAGMYPSGFDYMAPPPSYSGPPQNWTAPPQNWTAPPPPPPGNSKAAEAAGIAYYNPSNPHNVYMPMERPPPYAPFPDSPNKKNN